MTQGILGLKPSAIVQNVGPWLNRNDNTKFVHQQLCHRVEKSAFSGQNHAETPCFFKKTRRIDAMSLFCPDTSTTTRVRVLASVCNCLEVKKDLKALRMGGIFINKSVPELSLVVVLVNPHNGRFEEKAAA